MKGRWRLPLGLTIAVLVGFLAITLIFPASYNRLFYWWRGESLYDGHPTGYWIDLLHEVAVLDDNNRFPPQLPPSPPTKVDALLARLGITRAHEPFGWGGSVEALSAIYWKTPSFQERSRIVKALASAVTAVNETTASDSASAIKDMGPDAEAAIADLIQGLKSKRPLTVFYGGTFTPRDSVPGAAREALVSIRSSAVPVLRDALNSEDDLTRVQSAWALAELEGPSQDLIAILVLALKDTRADQRDHCIRYAARDALSAIGARHLETVLPTLLVTLKDPDEDIAMHAALTLQRMGPAAKPAIPSLIEALKDHRDAVHRCAGYALRAIGADAVPSLIEVLQDNNPEFRGMAAWTLSGMGKNARLALAELITALKDDPDVFVRERAAGALAEIGLDAQGAIPALRQALNDEAKEVRQTAAWALEKIEPGKRARGE